MEARDNTGHPTAHRMAPETESGPATDGLGAWSLAQLGEGLCPFCLESQGGQGSPGSVNSTVASVVGGVGPGPTFLTGLGTCFPSQHPP